MKQKQSIGLALGSGSAQGLAHIGVIKTLLNAGFAISCIAGTSIGAVVGGLYAATLDIEYVENVFLEIADKHAVWSAVPHKTKHFLFKDPDRVEEILTEKIRGLNIKETKIPFRAVATDIKTGEEVVLSSGSLERAIHASAAIPFVFKAIQIDGHVLIDGGFVDPVPVDAAKSMHPDFVLGVNISNEWPSLEKENLSLMGIESAIIDAFSALEFQVAKEKMRGADMVLHPPVLNYHWNDFRLAREIIERGENETRNNIGKIRKLAHWPKPRRTPLQKFIDLISGNDY